MFKDNFIVFEGIDGSGKSTLLNMTYDFLVSNNYKVEKTREPGGTHLAEKIRNIIINNNIDSMEEAYLFAVARRNHVREFINPSLSEGSIVLCDRFVYSSIAYQGCGRGLGEDFIKDLNKPSLNGIKPKLIIYLDVSPEVSFKRTHSSSREQNRLDNESLDFYTKVRESYLRLSTTEDNFFVINAEQKIEDVFKDIISILKKHI